MSSSDPTYVEQKDIFDSKMGAAKSFTINKWFKSSHDPANWTTGPVYPFSKCMEISESNDTGEGCLEIQNTQGSDASDFHDGNNSTVSTKDWTLSFWYKSPSSSAPTGSTLRMLLDLGKNWGCYIDTNGDFKLSNQWVSHSLSMPSGKDLFDGEWHLFTFAWKHDPDGSSSNWDYKVCRANDTGNEEEPGSSIWIDGVPFPSTASYNTKPPYTFSYLSLIHI